MVQSSNASLQIKQMLLAPQAAAVSAEFTALVHDAMAGNNDRDSIGPIRVPDRALSRIQANSMGQLFVGTSLGKRNSQEFVPHAHLKGRSRIYERYGEPL